MGPPLGDSSAVGLIFAARLLLALLGGITTESLAQHPLVTLPLDDPAYVQLDALDRLGCRPARISSARPYLVGAIARAVERAAAAPRCDPRLLRILQSRFPPVRVAAPTDTAVGIDPNLARVARPDSIDPVYGFAAGGSLTVRATALSGGEFRPLWRDVRPVGAGDPPAVATLRARLSWAERPYLVAVTEGMFQTDRRNDPTVREKNFHRTSAVVDFSEAYVTGRLGIVTASLGRSRDSWLGRESESMALSANGPPIDRVLVGFETRRVDGRSMIAMLDDVTLEPVRDSLPSGMVPIRHRRTLYAHLLTVRPTSALELSLGETMLSSRRTRELDLAYANPLMLFVVTQDDTMRRNFSAAYDNLGVFGGGRLRLGHATLRGELFVDELQIDRQDRRLLPDQLAWTVGATTPIPVGVPATIGVTYRRADTFTYLKTWYYSVYQRYDQPLGSELGPDATMLEGDAEVWLRGTVRLSASAGLWRRGATRIDDRPPRNGNEGRRAFPSVTTTRPSVQSAFVADASLQFLGARAPITFRVQTARIRNANNLSAPARLYTRAQLTGTYAFRYP